MKRLGFYLTGSQPVERVLPLIAKAAKGRDQRLLVVAQDSGLLDRLDKALWEESPEEFLAHGRGGEPHAERQPVLLAQDCEATNGAKIVALADGTWREEAGSFERVLLFFDEGGRQSARTVWKQFDQREGLEREFFELEGGRWVRRA